MDSIAEEDITLPIDFDQTTNFANYLLTRKQSNDTIGSTPETSMSEVFNYEQAGPTKNGGNEEKRPLTPNKGTMKEQEQLLSFLQKENFELKLRLYYLQGHLQRTFAEDTGDMLKTNIDLKVSIETLKKEKEDNQQLLVKASKALESVEREYETKIQRLREEWDAERQKNVDSLENDLKERTKEVRNLQMESKALQEKLTFSEKVVKDMKEREKTRNMINEKKVEAALEPLKSEILEKTRTIEVLSKELEDKTKEILEATDRAEKNEKVLKSMIEELEETLAAKDGRVQALEDQLKARPIAESHVERNGASDKQLGSSGEKDIEVKDLRRELRNKEQAIEGYKDYISRTEKVNKELRNSLHETESLKRRSSTAWQETIRRLEGLVVAKDKELSEQRKKISALRGELNNANANLEKIRKHQSDHGQVNKMANELADTKAELELKEHELIDLKNAIANRDQELKLLDESKQRAEEKLKNSLLQKEKDIASLKDELAQLLDKTRGSYSEMEEKLQQLQEDEFIKLSQKEKIIKKLATSVHAKDLLVKELTQSLIDSSHANQGEQELGSPTQKLLQNMREKLREKDEHIEKILDEGFKTCDAKDQSLIEVRRELREKEKSIDRMKVSIVAKDGVIKHLEETAVGKDKTIADLKRSFMKSKKDKKSLQETLMNDAKEKSKEILRLHHVIEMKDKHLQDKDVVSDAELPRKGTHSIAQEALSCDPALKVHPLHLSLEAAVKVKEQEVEDLKEQLIAAKEESGDIIHQLKNTLDTKEYELKALLRDMEKVKVQSKDDLINLRQSLQEKDQVLEDLMKESQEKDRLISELKDSTLTRRYSPSLANELAAIKDKVQRLENELRSKEEKVKLLLDENAFYKNMLNTKKDTENIEITMKFANLQNELAKRSDELTKTRELVQKLEHDNAAADIEPLKQEINTLSSVVADLRRREKDLNTEMGILQAAVAEQKAKVMLRENEIQQLKKHAQSKEQRNENEDAFKHKVASDKEKEAYEVTILDLKADIKSLEKVNETLKLQLDEAHTETKNVYAELIEAKTRHQANPDPSNLKEIIQLQFQELTKLNKAADEERRHYLKLTNDLLTANKSNRSDEETRDTLASTKALRQQLEASLQQSEALQEHLRSQIRDLQMTAKGNLTANSAVKDLEQQIRLLQYKLDESEQWNKSLQLRLSASPERRRTFGNDGLSQTEKAIYQSETDGKTEIDALTKEKTALESSLRILEREYETLKNEYDSLKSNEKCKEEEIARIVEEKAALEKQLKTERNKVASLNGQIDILQGELNAFMDSRRDRLSWGGQTDGRGEREEFEQETAQLNELNTFLKRELSRKQDECQLLKEKTNDLEREKLDMDKEKAEVEKQLLAANKTMEMANSELKSLRTKEHSLTDNTKKLSNENEGLRQSLTELETLNERLRNKLSEVTTAFELLKKKYGEDTRTYALQLKTSEEKLSVSEKNLREESGIVIDLKDKLKSVESETGKFKRLTEELQQSQATNCALQEEVYALAQAKEKKRNSLDAAITELRDEIKQLEQANEKLLKEKIELSRINQEESDRYKKIVQKLEHHTKDLELRLEGKEDAQAELLKLREELLLLSEKLKSLKEENCTLSEQVEQNKLLEEKLRSVQEELQTLREMKEKLEKRVEEVEASSGSLKEELTRLRMIGYSKDQIISQLQEDLTSARQQLEEIRSLADKDDTHIKISKGVQVSPSLSQSDRLSSYPQSQTDSRPQSDTSSIEEMKQRIDSLAAENNSKDRLIANLENYIETMTSSATKGNEGSNDQDSNQHLVLAFIQELRELRTRLTESITNNDRLKLQLEHRLGEIGKNAVKNNSELQDSVDLQLLLQESEEKNKVIEDLKETTKRLMYEREQDQEKIRSLHRQIRELKEISINLRQELTVYDNLHQQLETTALHDRSSGNSPGQNSEVDGDGKLDSKMLFALLEAIRKLHDQLDKSMAYNQALRKKLEEHLGHLAFDSPLSSRSPSVSNDGKSPISSPSSSNAKRRLFTSALHSIDVSPNAGSKNEQPASQLIDEMPSKDRGHVDLRDMKCPMETYERLKCQTVYTHDQIQRVSQMLMVLLSKFGKDNKILSDMNHVSQAAVSGINEITDLINQKFTPVEDNVRIVNSDENQQLRNEITALKAKLKRQDNLIRSTLSKLEVSQQSKEEWWTTVRNTCEMMKTAKEKLMYKVQEAREQGNGCLVVPPKK